MTARWNLDGHFVERSVPVLLNASPWEWFQLNCDRACERSDGTAGCNGRRICAVASTQPRRTRPLTRPGHPQRPRKFGNFAPFGENSAAIELTRPLRYTGTRLIWWGPGRGTQVVPGVALPPGAAIKSLSFRDLPMPST